MFPTLQIGPLSIATPGLITIIGLWIALNLSERRALLHQVSPNLIYNLTFGSIVAGIVGARIAFLARYPEALINNPLSLVSLNPGLLDPLAGTLVGIGFFFIFVKRSNVPIWNAIDALTPGIIFFDIALNFSQFAAGASVGIPTTLPWAVQLWGANRHPVQIYAILAGAGILGWIWFYHKQSTSSTAGILFLKSIIGLSAVHLFSAGFRAHSTSWIAGMRSEQIIAWIILATGLWLFQKRMADQSSTLGTLQ